MKSKDHIRQQLSEKFKDYEAEPQEDTWAKIRFGLDLKEKFSAYEAEPEDDTWSKIQLATQLSEKFRNYEVEPQGESWAKIQLATQLAEKFRHYEAEPQDESWKIIKAAIQPEKKRRLVILPIFYRAGIAASIALLLGFGWFLIKSKQGDLNGVSLNKNIQNQANTSINKTYRPTNQPQEKLPVNNHLDESLSNNNVLENPINNDLAGKRKPIPIQVKGRNKNIDEILKKETFAQNKVKIRQHKEKNNLPIIEEDNKPNETNTIAENKKVIIPQTESDDKTLTFNILSSKSFKEKLIRKPFGAIAYNNEAPMMEEEGVIKRKLIFSTSLMPLQAYQALTILPQTNTYIQQVGTLNALDAQRLGIQFRIGAMKPLSNRFSTGASLTYSGIQQRVSYEVNNGEYEIQTTDSQSYTLVGVNESINQSKFLQTVGLKIDNSFLISKKKNEVYVSGGGEAVRVINDKEYAYYLNASVGVSYPTKGGKSIWIEPTFRYSLSQSLDAYNYLQIRPYNVGLNVRVNFM
ncbi:hypothetical protein [Emticicia sp. SJ17W-69]|uniref:hypothetical protein n=1 Tax=Emticicia sp. SJ17W-69 TaxID=3421657 RepID=UPI003EBDB466